MPPYFLKSDSGTLEVKLAGGFFLSTPQQLASYEASFPYQIASNTERGLDIMVHPPATLTEAEYERRILTLKNAMLESGLATSQTTLSGTTIWSPSADALAGLLCLYPTDGKLI